MVGKRSLLPFIIILFFIVSLGFFGKLWEKKHVFGADEVIYLFEYPQTFANNDNYYDTSVFLGTLQGLANRDGPNFYLLRSTYQSTVFDFGANGGDFNVDQYWLDKFREPGQWLSNNSTQRLTSIEQVIAQFRDGHIQCLIVWDPEVDATVNVATSVAGAENCPVVMKNSTLYNLLVNTYQVSVRIDLSGKFSGSGTIWQTERASTGSKKTMPIYG